MNLCLYTNTALPLIGGQEHVVDALARQFTEMNHEASVLAPRSAGCSRTDRSFAYAVRRHLPFISTHRFVSAYGHFLRRLHQRERFDVIHCHGVYPTGYIAARRRDALECPVVITGHGEHTSARRLENPVLRRRFAFAIEHADALISISDSIREGYLNLCPGAGDRIIDIPNGVDVQTLAWPVARPTEVPNSIEAGKYFLFMGRLKPRKGVDVLIKAFSRASLETVRLVIAGDGPERRTLENLTGECECDDRIHFVGAVSGDLKTWLYQNSITLVAPSRVREGQPLVVLESFAAGRPVIASDLPGLKDLVRPGQTGLLAPAESSDAFAHALQQALNDPEALDRMHEELSGIAARQSWEQIAHRHLELFGSLIENDGARGRLNAKTSA